ncbi:VOC family protein [Rhodococcus sp. IEGM 1307]|jgi:catechol 2,3-dioxygenase-like lactoylglutathione lyase family enzyme|uniref:VOC family protein n=1 Tax=Rhodococcus sp. IEGM 1307 TaxID=3047091 RepID=UPI0024B7F3BC|nr:VOC family protein [Rhodococcus sp. IEGM 1307]MDI9978693.1 VOC family protein [Rhodococcus sp. IEGM 1307]
MQWAVDHVGFTVPDLDQAVDFFVSALGCEVVLRSGPDPNVGYIWPGESEAEAAVVRLAVLTHASQHNIELLEYKNTSATSVAPRPSQPGGCHLAFYVEDVQAAVDHLTQFDGVRMMGQVMTEESGPIEGLDWVYILTPWGMAIELLRWMPGLPYEATTEARLVSPAFLAATPALDG